MGDFRVEKLTASLEDFLEIICNYSNANKGIRAVDISRKLNISRASVTEALKKLANKGYINYERKSRFLCDMHYSFYRIHY